MTLALIVVAAVLAAASGLPGLLLRRSSPWGQRVAAMMMVGAAIVGLGGVCSSYASEGMATMTIPWLAAGRPVVGVDALSAFFLVPILLMGGLGAVYGLGYWPQGRHSGNGRKLSLFWGLMVSGLVLLVIARDGMSFLLGWEVMALSAFFLVSTEDCRAPCREAAWVYLIATHVGTLTLFGMFALWRWQTGSYALRPAAEGMSMAMKNTLFFVALFGFGLKAGLMPLHFWLPAAHANAPSHVSAMLSGIVLKMGIYGLIRMLSLLPSPPLVWGGLILLLGLISGLLGVVFAIAQHDLKRLLAYHSVENIGIILMGLGMAMLGRSAQRPEWVVVGMAACLLHVWNHSFFKPLLFLCAGSVVSEAHTRKIDRLGGLAKMMPWTAALFVIGAVAICGLPPLNGFVSELLVYMGSLRPAMMKGAGAGAMAVMLVAPVLAMIGALAVACFVKVFGAVFLGSPRTSAAVDAHEAPMSMRGPAVVLAGCCIIIGLAPIAVVPILDRAIGVWWPSLRQMPMSVGDLVPFKAVGAMAIALAVLTLALGFLLARQARGAARVGTWDCGYARPTNRMQYSASSFAQMIVAMFNWVLHPRTHLPQLAGWLASPAEMHTHVNEAVLDRLLLPSGRRIEQWFGWFRRFQQGATQHYVLYILITVIAMLGTLIPFNVFLLRLFAP